MTEDVGTTKRERLTPRDRLALFERRQGKCCVCGLKIQGEFIDEHWRALGLGGSNDISNRDIAHPRCAASKTRDDLSRIAKAKRQKRKELGIKQATAPIHNRNDLPEKDEEKGKKAHERIEKLMPPRRGGIAAQYPESAGGVRGDDKE